MKILFCTNAFGNITNGPAKFANLILEINRLYPQHEVRVLTEDAGTEQRPGPAAVYPVSLRIPAWLKPLGQVVRMFQYADRIRQIEQQYAFDVLVYNNAFTGLYASVALRKPTVGMINDDNNLSAGLRNFRPARRWLKRYFFKQLERAAARRHRCVITNSDYLTRQVQQVYRLPPGRLHRLYKAVDLGHFTFNPRRPFGNPVKILFVKADYRRGGLPVLAAALRGLPQARFLVTVIGPEETFRADIEGLFRDGPHVALDYRGAQPPAAVRALMQQYDLFCVPSYQEALGVANMEALASGIPVVSTAVGGIPEVLDQGRNGWLVPPGDATALARAIAACVADEKERHRRAEAGRRFVEKFSKEKMFENFIQILQQCNR